MTLAGFAYTASAILVVLCAAVMVLLVLVRLVKDRTERRRLTVRAPVWRVVLTLSSGEGTEVDDAYARLLATSPSERQAVVHDAFALLPKLRGDARQRLREVLRAWDTTRGARNSTRSRSAVRRSRGYYRLGVLAEPGRRDLVLRGLADRDFIARRTAMLALGSFRDPLVVERMLDAAVEEPRLRRDFLASVDRRGQLAAEALGLVGAVDAVGALEAATPGAPAEMQVACLNALGRIGAPTSVRVLTDALGHDSAEVRRVAAQSLGLVGGRIAVAPLGAALHDASTEVARAAANGLRRCGPPGRSVLEGSPAPVAREVLALAALGSS